MISQASSGRPSNQVLASLSAADFHLLEGHLRAINLPVRFPIEGPNKPITRIYFPESGIISVVAATHKQQIEVGIIGRDGMTGLNVVMGDGVAEHSTYVQMPGAGLFISSRNLRSAMNQSASLHKSTLHSALAFMSQVSHTALSNGRAKIEERLARWLLMAHDRTDGNELAITHEFLALMMCVRRAGVTDAMSVLKKKRLIDTGRGTVVVRNRAGLKKYANGFYGLPEAESLRLTGWKAKG